MSFQSVPCIPGGGGGTAIYAGADPHRFPPFYGNRSAFS